MSYEFLQQYWWFVISLLGGLLVFLLFVQGGQSMIFSLSKTDDERRLLVNVLGRKWEYTFTTLVTFGGAFFASFPLFYSTSFGGAYWAWIVVLLCFVIQAVSYEFQSKPGNLLGKKTWQTFLLINGIGGTFLLGVVVATLFTGSDFTVNKANLTNLSDMPIISTWNNAWHGLDALANPRNWLLGFAVLFLSRTLASLYFINRLEHKKLEARAKKFLWYNAIPFLVFFLAFVIWTLSAKGFAVDPSTGDVSLVAYKYFINLIEMPLVLLIFLTGVVGVLFGITMTVLKDGYKKGIWFTGAGTVLAVLALFLILGYNNTAFYPAVNHSQTVESLQSSLTIYNASSSYFTLKTMFYVSFFIPFVLAYIFYAWRSLEKKPSTVEDLDADGHAY
ncbi:MAG: cytochrome d ubiquinol oxidase subunit II [Prevotellaceae bacterium]|jgi:cytochrome d ubiquinol oxidase subunit II|nr:cytochrome d ubiquinol oxidase subunit II [Prevotellaceae bacterium]